jgi:ATPase subunit of ABC transporter with duplicated ATPase domains
MASATSLVVGGGSSLSKHSEDKTADASASASASSEVSLSSLLEIRGKTESHRNLIVGHLSQHHIDTMSSQLDLTPIQYLQNQSSSLSDLAARAHLGKFGISGPVAMNPIAALSGGQKARLALAAACLRSPHILLLDEPTNHLSMDSIEALAEAVRSFEGTAIVISHNQWFLNATCDELLLVRGGKASLVHTPIQALNDRKHAASGQGNQQKGKKGDRDAEVRATSACDYSFAELLASYVSSQAIE